jgi:hypothetical protein
MTKRTAFVIWVTFALVSAYLLFIPGNGSAARKAAVTHIRRPIPSPEVLDAHKAAILARHRWMVTELRRQRRRVHVRFLQHRRRERRLAELRAQYAPPQPTPSPSSIPSPVPTGTSPQAYAASLLDPAEYNCIDQIFTRESGWQVDATNPTSGAYGIPQALPGDKMATAGADWQTNPQTQIRWAVGYVDDTYGSACAAWAYWQVHGNY